MAIASSPPIRRADASLFSSRNLPTFSLPGAPHPAPGSLCHSATVRCLADQAREMTGLTHAEAGACGWAWVCERRGGRGHRLVRVWRRWWFADRTGSRLRGGGRGVPDILFFFCLALLCTCCAYARNEASKGRNTQHRAPLTTVLGVCKKCRRTPILFTPVHPH